MFPSFVIGLGTNATLRSCDQFEPHHFWPTRHICYNHLLEIRRRHVKYPKSPVAQKYRFGLELNVAVDLHRHINAKRRMQIIRNPINSIKYDAKLKNVFVLTIQGRPGDGPELLAKWARAGVPPLALPQPRNTTVRNLVQRHSLLPIELHPVNLSVVKLVGRGVILSRWCGEVENARWQKLAQGGATDRGDVRQRPKLLLLPDVFKQAPGGTFLQHVRRSGNLR